MGEEQAPPLRANTPSPTWLGAFSLRLMVAVKGGKLQIALPDAIRITYAYLGIYLNAMHKRPDNHIRFASVCKCKVGNKPHGYGFSA